VGRGDLDAGLDRMVQVWECKDKVIRIAYLPDTARFLGGLEAFLLTSRYEGLSFAILELLSDGLPMVLTWAPGSIDFMELSLSYLESADVGGVVGVRRVIDRFLARMVPSHATHHREMVMKYYSVDECYGRVTALYEDSPKRRP